MSNTSDVPYASGGEAEADYFQPANEPWADPDLEATSSHALFDGDCGRLTPEQRRLLVVLLKNRFITSASHPEEWRALIADPGSIRTHLNDMFLALHMDTSREVAFKRQATPDVGPPFPTLLRATEWTREETILLVHLRQVAHAALGAGDAKAYADREDLLEHLAEMRPAHLTNLSTEQDRAARAIESLASAGLLLGRKDSDRFEIARAVDALLPLEALQQLLGWITADAAPRVARPDDLTSIETTFQVPA